MKMETFVSFKKETIAFIIENKAAAIWLIRLYIFRIYRFTKGKHIEVEKKLNLRHFFQLIGLTIH